MMKEKVTIANATDIFNELMKFDTDFPVFDELASLANLKANGSIPNDSFLDALLLNRYMFKNTKYSLRMLTGHTGDISFLSILKQPFLTALNKIKSHNGKAKIIFIGDDHSFCNAPDVKSFIDNGTLEVKNVSMKEPDIVKHFIVCDNMVRMERPHPALTKESPANLIQADVYFNAEAKSKMQNSFFDGIWDLIPLAT